MTTSQPIATISYNTETFLKSKLDYMIEKDFIDFYAYIKHLPEQDEKKSHIHLYIIPSSKTNTKSLLSLLEEKDENNDKPLKCLPAVSSKFADWYLYGLHDEKYLLSKGQQRMHKYQATEVVSSCDEFLEDCVHRIDRSKFVGLENIIYAVENGIPFRQLVRSGQVPIQLINQYKEMYNYLYIPKQGDVDRGDRVSHTPKNLPYLVDIETGQVYSSFAEYTVKTGTVLNASQGLVDDVD